MESEILEETTSEENIVTVETIPQSLTSEENVFQPENENEDGNLIIKCLKYLPVGYNYIVMEEKYESDTNFEVEFRCNIKTEDEAKQWMEILSERSYVTWRIGKTHPDAGRYNVFKIEYRCRHKGAHKPKEGSSRRSYNTQCPAWLTLTIKRYVDKSRARKLDDETAKENPCVIRLKNIHNHQIGTSEVLRIRDVSEQVKEKLRALYRAGYTPLNAYNKLHMDAMIEHGEDYFRIAADRRFCPNKSFCYDLYYAEFKKSCRVDASPSEEPEESSVIQLTDIPDVFDINHVILTNDNDVTDQPQPDNNSSNLNLIPVVLQDESNQAIIIIQQQLDDTQQQTKIESIDHVTGELEQCLNEIYSRLTSPPITAEKVSAMINFITNYKQNAQSESNLLTATQNFAHVDTSKRKRKIVENNNSLIKKRKSYPSGRRTTTKQQTHVVISSKEMHSYTQLE